MTESNCQISYGNEFNCRVIYLKTFRTFRNLLLNLKTCSNAFKRSKRVQATPAEQDSRTECCLLKPDIASPLHEFGI